MELKVRLSRVDDVREPSLNRTFYGIESGEHRQHGRARQRLNRTFYGIERRCIPLCERP